MLFMQLFLMIIKLLEFRSNVGRQVSQIQWSYSTENDEGEQEISKNKADKRRLNSSFQGQINC